MHCKFPNHFLESIDSNLSLSCDVPLQEEGNSIRCFKNILRHEIWKYFVDSKYGEIIFRYYFRTILEGEDEFSAAFSGRKACEENNETKLLFLF
jgi:hypothetical protein